MALKTTKNFDICLFKITCELYISCRLFVVNAIFSTGIVVCSVSWLWQLSTAQATRKKKLQNLFKIFALTTKGLQEIKHNFRLGRRWKKM